MDLKIYAKNVDLNAEAERYIQKKFSRLERHLRPISDAKLEVSRTSAKSQSQRIVVQLTIGAGGHTLRGQESGINLFGAIDAVADVMDRQIQRYKGTTYRTEQAKKSARAGRLPAGAFAEEAPQDEPVVRTKRFAMTPMTVENAIEEMEFLNHDFFLFFNVETDEYNVAYRRSDGGYGVIEPELT